jgi:type VI secretion system protein ImpK
MDRITEVTRDCFDALIQLRRLDDAALPAPEALHERLRSFVDAMFQQASQAGLSREDANDIAYAIVALADEIVLTRSESLRDFWAGRSLQLHYFRENVAGDAFFTRLEGVRRDPRRRDVLRVYYLALLFGFQGGHRVRGGELELMRLVDDLHRDLQHGRRIDAEALSPHGERPEEKDRGRKRVGLVLWVATGALALAILTYAGFWIALGAGSGDVAQRIENVSLK